MAAETGVYMITCMPTGKQYVGSSGLSMRRRLQAHRSLLVQGKHPSSYMQRAWNKYGEAAFQFGFLELCPSNESLGREQYWLDTLKPAFNARKIVESNLGCVQSTEAREKKRKLMLARYRDHPEKKQKGEEASGARLTEGQVLFVLSQYGAGAVVADLAAELGAGARTLHSLIQGHTWTGVSRRIDLAREEALRNRRKWKVQREGMRVADALSLPTGRNDCCKNGHPYNETNTYIARDGGRNCRVCGRERASQRRAERSSDEQDLANAKRRVYEANRRRLPTDRVPCPARARPRVTHCKHGHAFDEANTYITPVGNRACRVCRLAAQRRFDAKRKAAAS